MANGLTGAACTVTEIPRDRGRVIGRQAREGNQLAIDDLGIKVTYHRLRWVDIGEHSDDRRSGRRTHGARSGQGDGVVAWFVVGMGNDPSEITAVITEVPLETVR